MFEQWYQRAYESGYNARLAEDHSDQNRRLEDMLRRGKELGYQEGYMDGYKKGYEIGYAEGELDTRDKMGIIEVSQEEFDELTKESEDK